MVTVSPAKLNHPWAVKIANEGIRQGLPVEKIRQRLVLEGLEPELITPVLNRTATSASTDSSVALAFPPSPLRRQVSARKYHDMLSIGVPPSAVRQRMAMEGCSPAEINSFFASQTTEGEKQGRMR